MHASASFSTPSPLRHAGAVAWPMILCGGLAIAATDLIYCLLYWSPQGVAPARLLQGIAAGALGAAAFAGGAATAVLGAGLQWLIGSCFVLAYALVATRVALLRAHPHRYGIAYGLLLYLLMNGVVLPLSAAPAPKHPQLAWMLLNIPMFALFGTIAARFAVGALGRRVRG
ncbi:hypothetical protein [Lysobacter solisilvae (ex Woo and Kim 2020)]|uniref:DUF1440 domain-containing protein n=1 Tax=Agrilutibacter terrestris TaxID=2865112 RepID=A0A7H0FV09_9GAMM|nr:hypothetical protein [Lysobacter terrestris]QNP39875.1 hypothetical protein H8B22_10190 [Lysobacter terrestris]